MQSNVMNRRYCHFYLRVFLAATLIALAGSAAIQAAEGSAHGGHCTVNYSGIDPSWATGFAQIHDIAYEGYQELIGLALPEQMQYQITVTGSATRLWTDGQDHVFLELRSEDDLQPSAPFHHVYGICHELGHIVLYSRMSTLAGLPDGVGEGWAHYCGSLMVDYLWQQLGASAYPVPYDYSLNGSQRLERQCSEADKDVATLAACTFYAIGEQYGHAKVGRSMRAALQGEPRGDELMGRFAKAVDTWAGKGASELIPEAVRKTQLKIEPGALNFVGSEDDSEGDGDWLAYDDDQEDGMRSMAGSGHAVRFHVKGGGKLIAVMLKGARYGYPQSDSQFRITVCDGDFEPIQEIRNPFRAFEQRGEPLYWRQFNLTGVKVPADFFIVFDFNPTATDGVYVGFDADSTGHSYSALPGSHLTRFRDGDWMIRVKVE